MKKQAKPVKVLQIPIYTFDQLSKEAKEKALNKYIETAEFYWADDYLKSLKGFAEHFGASLKNYSIDFHPYGERSSVEFDLPDEEPAGDELKALIYEMGTFNIKTLRGDGDCKFTGMCADEDAADGARIAYIKGKERNLENLLMAGFESLLKAGRADYAHQLSKKGFSEYCQGNDILFEADGRQNRH